MSHDLVLITIAGLLLAGLGVELLGRRIRLPRVTLLVLLGIIAGPSGLALLPAQSGDWYPLLAAVALVMVAFLLGGRLTRRTLLREGRPVLMVSGAAVIVTAIIVFIGLTAIGIDPILALLLAGISTATDPAATADIVGKAGERRAFGRILLGVVTIDDAWGLIVFSILLAIADAFSGNDPGGSLTIALREIGGAAVIGVAIGVPAAYLTGRLERGEATRVEALGIVLLTGGVALFFDVSFLLTAMIVGLVIANLARHHTRPFHEIQNFQWPFMLLFFVLAGASLDVAMLPAIGLVGIGYIVLRTAGRLVGGWLGASLAKMAPVERRWMGATLMPQAGVAIGMALVAAESFPAYSDIILAVAVGSTVVFEVAGPILTRIAMDRTGAAESAAPKHAGLPASK